MMNQSTKLGSSTKFWIDYLNQSELNSAPRTIGHRDLLSKNIYSSFELFTGYDQTNDSPSKSRRRKSHGPICDLCFTPEDGKMMIAGTADCALLFFDSLNHRLINQLDDAHSSSINQVKFIDSNLFATCSNDEKIRIWDRRNAKRKLKTLAHGHLHCIKNLEYDPQLRYLVSSGLDGAVIVWDLFGNSSDQLEPGFTRARPQDSAYKRVFSLECLRRMRMSSDHSKMVISTSEGYLMVIHDLDLRTLNEDLKDFQSDLYRLMQKKHSTGFDFGSWMNSLFVSKRNRVELISDFPTENEAHRIGSLDIHPQNWCVLSRNLSRDENSEWTCVHNIQDYERPNEMMYIEMPKTDNIYFPHAMFRAGGGSRVTFGVRDENSVLPSAGPSGQSASDDRRSASSRDRTELSYSWQSSSQQSGSHQSGSNQSNSHQSGSYQSNSHQSGSRVPVSSGSITADTNPSDLHISPVIIISARSSRRAQTRLLSPNSSYRQIKPGSGPPPKIFCNLNRMTHYIEELDQCTEEPFFKEPHFSGCGRFIASPSGRGFRLLSFNAECTELCDEMLSSQFRAPKKLYEIKQHQDHSNQVTTVNFSPANHLIVSGCLNGEVKFYQPAL